MQMRPYYVLTAMAILVILPISAHRGRGNRGIWAVMMVLALLAAGVSFRVLCKNLALFHSMLTDAELAERLQTSRSEIDRTISWSFATFLCSAGTAAGSALAVCFFKSKAAVTKLVPRWSSERE